MEKGRNDRHHKSPESVWLVFCKLFSFKAAGFSKLQLNFFKKSTSILFFCFFLRTSSEASLSHFTSIKQLLIFSIFSRQTRPSSLKPVRQTTATDNQIRTRSHHQIRIHNRPSSDPTTKSGHQISRPSPPIQTTTSDHPTRPQDTILDYSASNQHSITNLLKWYRSGEFFMGWVKGGT